MATGTPPKVEPNEEVGRSLSRRMFGGSGEEIDLDSERLREIGYEWQRKANLLRDAADKIERIGIDAAQQAQEFISEYETPGSYTADYSSLAATDAQFSAKLYEASAQAEKLAGACAWIADNWEEAQKEAVAGTESVDTDILNGTHPNGGTPDSGELQPAGTEGPIYST